MPDTNRQIDSAMPPDHRSGQKPPFINVASSPHIADTRTDTRRMMIDVILGLSPAIVISLYLFRFYALKQLIVCVVACLGAEYLFVRMRGNDFTLKDCSAMVTGVILGLSMPGSAPWFVGALASLVGIGIGKIIFGGVGMNIFNPAMVGRAFVMIAFAQLMGAGAYENVTGLVDAVSGATPLSALKFNGVQTDIAALFMGGTNGSVGEVSAIACIIGGLYLIYRKTASWQIPASILVTVALVAGITDIAGGHHGLFLLHHLCAGALMFGAFFIATDPVTSPLTVKGKVIFGVGTGCLIMVIRLFSGYPEGVMFAVLIMNAITPLINRWTIPKPMGQKEA